MGTKQEVIAEILRICEESGEYKFTNDLVKKVSEKYGFANSFDITKLDDTSKFPEVLLEKDYFILHLGEGEHQFVRGIKNGFHTFEKISDDNIYSWKYRKSILNEFDTSESNILSVANNQSE